MIQRLFIALITLLSFNVISQHSIDLFDNPVNIPLKLAGNFAELRQNHFHMGVDIKTQGKEGLKIFSVSKGYVARIRISSFGYGKAIYINHENGTTSVYAHLQRLSPKLDSIVRIYQKEQQNWDIDLNFDRNQLIIDHGEFIALSGNTGGSTAPHLHFEIRNTETEHALNPLLMGLNVLDTRKPEIKSIKLFGVQEDGYMIPGKTMTVPLTKDKFGELRVKNDTLKINKSFFTSNGGIGIAIDAHDKLNSAENICGLYGSSLFINGELNFGHEMNEITFDESRYINTHRDISETNKNLHKLFRTRTNQLGIYKTENLGVINFKENDQHLNIEILAYDEKHNSTCIQFVLQLIEGLYSIDPFINQLYIQPKDSLTIKNNDLKFKITENTFYEPTKKNNKPNMICQANQLIQKFYEIELKGPSDHLSQKRYLEVGTKALKTNFSDGFYRAKSNVVGEVTLKIDTIAPLIINIQKTIITNLNQIKFEISDWGSGIKTYYLYINNEWCILEYEYKNKKLFSYEDKQIPPNSTLRLEVIDMCNNMAAYEEIINRR